MEDILAMKNIPQSFIEGLSDCYWPGRSDVIQYNKSITLFIDGAHTPESMEACREWFLQKLAVQKVFSPILVFNCNTSRDPLTLLKFMAVVEWEHVIFTSNDSGKPHLLEDKRSMEREKKLTKTWQEKMLDAWISLKGSKNTTICHNVPNVLTWLENYREQYPEKHLSVLITGSLYHVGAWFEVVKPEMCD